MTNFQAGDVATREAVTTRGVVIQRNRVTVLRIDGDMAEVVDHSLQRYRSLVPLASLRIER